MKHEWKLTFTFQAGFLMAGAMIDEIKQFCFQNDIQVQFLKTGVVVKDISVRMTGYHTDSEIHSFKVALETWGKKLENM